MIRRVPHLALALLAAAALLAPSALASGGKPKKHHKGSGSCVSAVCVYHEPGSSASGSYQNSGGPPVPLESALAQKLAKFGGSDARALENLATSRAFGVTGKPNGEPRSGISVSAPGAFLAALDLGPGPIALFITLLAGATAFGLGGALRRRRFHA